MKQGLTQEQKNKIFGYSAGGLIFLLLFILTTMALIMVSRQSRDAVRLSAINTLHAELALYYHNRNKFPEKILDRADVRREEECLDNLCIHNYPTDPKSGERYFYLPCYDYAGENCEEGIVDAKGFRLVYNLETY